MMKTTTWPTSPDRGCAKRHKKINEALDNPHRKSLPPLSLSQPVRIHRKFFTQLADLYGDPSKRSVVIHAAKRTGDKVCDDFHLVFLHAPGCYRWRADTDATGHERGSSIEWNGIPIDRDMRFIQRFLRDLTGQFGLAQVDEHQMVIGAFGRQAKAFID